MIERRRPLSVARGTQRLLVTLGHSCVCELPLASGRRADLVALRHDGEIWIIEIKSSIEDFRVDQKWPDYRLHCDRLYFATAAHVPAEIFPPDAGLIVADAYGGELLRSLEAFIEQNGQWERAAREVYCHRHTLRYRMRKVEELTGRDLSRAHDRIEFWLALRARELVGT